jgi:arginase
MNRTIRTFGVPMDLGQRRRGVDMGPSALRYAGLDSLLRALGHTVTDYGDLPVPLPENEPPDPSTLLTVAGRGPRAALVARRHAHPLRRESCGQL